MPLLRIQTNRDISVDIKQAAIKAVSELVANEIDKPERYVMVAFEPAQPMVFAGSDDACAFLELKSIGLTEDKTKQLSAALCEFIYNQLGIPVDRVYIEFTNSPRAMWGWNGSTF